MFENVILHNMGVFKMIVAIFKDGFKAVKPWWTEILVALKFAYYGASKAL